MIRTSLAILAFSLTTACTGGGGDVLKNDVEEEPVVEPEPDPDAVPDGVTGIPETLSRSVTGFSFDTNNSTVTVEVVGLDTTPLEATYVRDTRLDMAGYAAYSVQEDALDRLYVALGAQTPDGSARAAIVSDGGQFNRIIQGGFYARDGSYDPPAIGTGPGAGQVSYAGNYAGITNATSADGFALLDVDPNTPGLPDLPGQGAMIRATIFLNANFAENQVNGSINNRILVSPIDGTDAQQLEDLELIITDIDENGEFFGDVEFQGQLNMDVGDYGGIFSGPNASFVAGVVYLTNFTESRENDTEVGVFVLTQCGQPGDAAVCDLVEPN